MSFFPCPFSDEEPKLVGTRSSYRPPSGEVIALFTLADASRGVIVEHRQSTEFGDHENPLVSVIIPTYGRPERLSRTIQSVAAQSYKPIELLIVDDGSPEPVTEGALDADLGSLKTVSIIRHEENRGANAARNTGIRSSSGTYLAFLDDDDWWRGRKIEKQVSALQAEGPSVGVAYTGKESRTPWETQVVHPTAEGNVMKALLTGTNLGQFSSIMVARRLLSFAGYPDERFPAWQDREWFFRLAQHTHFCAVPEILTIRDLSGSDRMSHQFEEKRDTAYPLFIEKHYDMARDYGLYYARTFLATLRRGLARSAIHAGEYAAARRYFLAAFLANPLHTPVYPDLLASLGGERSYVTLANFRRRVVGE